MSCAKLYRMDTILSIKKFEKYQVRIEHAVLTFSAMRCYNKTQYAHGGSHLKTSKLMEQSRQTRRSILDAAEKLFFSQGYANTTVDDICTAAGITKGAFYHHFKNKDVVYRQRYIHKLDTYLEAHYRLSEAPTAYERYLKLAQCTFDSSRACGKELVGQSMIGQLSNQESTLYDISRPHTQALAAAYDAAVAEGCLPQRISLQLSIMLYACMMTGFLFKWASSPEADSRSIDWDRLLELEIASLMNCLFHGA